jgi:dTDP-4-dehydrorhamnose reductase
MMKVLILGASGMLGHKLVQSFSQQFETVGTVRDLLRDKTSNYCFKDAKIVPGVGVEDIATITKILDNERPDVVINCIGIIKQLKVSKDPLPVLKINAIFPQLLAKHCVLKNMRLVHFSTDCVFSGQRGNYSVQDMPDCDELYGISKLLGEVSLPGCLTIRTSIVGRELKNGVSLIEWFLSQKNSQVKGYANAQYTGFTTNEMANIVANLLINYPKLDGVWHISSDPISKYALLQLVNEIFNLDIRIERDDQFKCDRRLDSSEFRAKTNFRPLSWEQMIQSMYVDPTPYTLMV